MARELYHYCSNDKSYNILKSKSIRLSDIQKSNDYRELSLFFPKILDYIEEFYHQKPFRLQCDGKIEGEALSKLLSYSYDYWRNRFSSGDFSNFVLCFSEAADSLSQWRGYADNGRGCCLGFSKDELERYCLSTNGVLQLKQVTYLVEEGIDNAIRDAAKDILQSLKGLRRFIVSEITNDNNHPDTDGLLHYNFDGMLEAAFIDSLQYKSFAFHEECEWRMFFTRPTYKNPGWMCDKTSEPIKGPRGFAETIAFLQDRIDFHPTVDDLIPYCRIGFEEFVEPPIRSVWLGPKNKIRISDMELFLKKNEYDRTKVIASAITYC